MQEQKLQKRSALRLTRITLQKTKSERYELTTYHWLWDGKERNNMWDESLTPLGGSQQADWAAGEYSRFRQVPSNGGCRTSIWKVWRRYELSGSRGHRHPTRRDHESKIWCVQECSDWFSSWSVSLPHFGIYFLTCQNLFLSIKNLTRSLSQIRHKKRFSLM